MLDALHNPSFINLFALHTTTSQVPQGLIQPVPQPRGVGPKEAVRPKRDMSPHLSEVSSTTNLIKLGRTTAPSTVTSVGPSVTLVGDTSSVRPTTNVYEHHDGRYAKKYDHQVSTGSLVGTTQKVSIHSTPEVITDQGTQRDSVPVELTANTMSNS